MFIRRDRITPALIAVAVAMLGIAVFLRPQALPPGSVHFAAQTAPVVAEAGRKAAAPGVSYAIDSLEWDGQQNPITGTRISAGDRIIVHGWAVAPDTLVPGDQLERSIDGAAALPVTNYGIARPDVATAINPTAVNSGFSATIPTAGLAPGTHTIRFFLRSAGKLIPLPTAVTFTVG